jgi:hypothetical protein
MATKIARLVPLGLLFVGPYEELGTLREGKPPGPPEAPFYCSLHGSDKRQAEGSATALANSLTSVYQTRQATYV